MKITNIVLDKTPDHTSGNANNQQIFEQQKINPPIYLKDGYLKHQCFVEERHKNIDKLNSFRLHMEKTGKICPKAWHWGRFYKLFRPMHESYWLTTWWETTDDEKCSRFNEQLNFLATQTVRFGDAYSFLLGIEDKYWHYKVRDTLAGHHEKQRRG